MGWVVYLLLVVGMVVAFYVAWGYSLIKLRRRGGDAYAAVSQHEADANSEDHKFFHDPVPAAIYAPAPAASVPAVPVLGQGSLYESGRYHVPGKAVRATGPATKVRLPGGEF